MSLRPSLWRAVLGGAVASALIAAAPAVASADVSSLTVSPSSVTAGSTTTSLTLSYSFSAPVSSLTTEFPPGLLADGSIDGGACLTTTATVGSTTLPPAPCQIGSGSANSGAILVSVYLVKGPSPTDFAGLDLVTAGTNAAVGDVTFRPATDPDRVGLNVSFSSATPLPLTNLTVTLTHQRMPTSCPLTPANVIAAANSQSTPATAPLAVTGCSSLPFAPSVGGSAKKDVGDPGAQVTTVVTQGASEAAIASSTLTVPSTVLAPNPLALGLAGSTTPVGVATVTSPLLPASGLTGNVYLTSCATAGNNCVSGLGLSIRFPNAFNLNGSVALTGGVTFANVPDVPVSVLAVVLNGGREAAFIAPCAATSGTLTAAFVGQNGVHHNASAPFTVSGCPTSAGKPTLSGASLTGLPSGHPRLHFRVTHGTNAPGIKTVSVGVSSGLGFHASRTCKGKGKKRRCTTTVKGLSVSGGKLKSARVSGGRLTITLKVAASSVSITVKGPGLTESRALQQRVKKHQVRKVGVTIRVTDASGKSTPFALKLA